MSSYIQEQLFNLIREHGDTYTEHETSNTTDSSNGNYTEGVLQTPSTINAEEVVERVNNYFLRESWYGVGGRVTDNDSQVADPHAPLAPLDYCEDCEMKEEDVADLSQYAYFDNNGDYVFKTLCKNCWVIKYESKAV